MNESSRAERFAAIVADYFEALAKPGSPVPLLQNLLTLHPDLQQELHEFYADVQAVQQRLAPLRELVGSATPAPPLPGSIEHYQLGKEIGHGGMGVVVRAHDSILRRDVAIKIMRESAQERPDLVHRFIAEAQILGQLEHPYIVPLHQLGELADKRPFLAMKLVQGRNLADLLREDRPKAPEALAPFLDRTVEIFSHICKAIAFAHERGVLHRDLKPSNVMVGAQGEIQVMDWGLAKVRLATGFDYPKTFVDTLRQDTDGLQSQAGSIIGTLNYMSPEQAAGEVGDLDERCDVFGLGAILCEVLTEKPPYIAANAVALKELATEARLQDAWERLSQCPGDVEIKALARKCLSKNPAHRPTNAGEVVTALEQYRTNRQEQARQDELKVAAANARAKSEESRRKSEESRRRFAYGLAAAVVLLACASLVAGWFYVQQREREIELHHLQQEREAEGKLHQQGTAQGVESALEEMRARHKAMKTAPLNDLERLADEAVVLAHKADDLARRGPASEQTRQLAAEALAAAKAEKAAATRDSRLVRALFNSLELSLFKEGMMPSYLTTNETGQSFTSKKLAENFKDYGLDLSSIPVADAQKRIRTRPNAVVLEIISALDNFALTNEGSKDSNWESFLGLAEALDEPNSLRQELRAVLKKKDVDSAPEEGKSSPRLQKLRALAKTCDPTREPALTVRLLAYQLERENAAQEAEHLLRQAVKQHPSEPLLLDSLGSLLHKKSRKLKQEEESAFSQPGLPVVEKKVSTWRIVHEESLGYYRALRAVRPEATFMLALLSMLDRQKDDGEADEHILELVKKHPSDMSLIYLAFPILVKRNRHAEARALLWKDYEAHPNDLDLLFLALLAVDERNWEEADRITKEGIKSYPNAGLLYGLRGEILMSMNRESDALENYRAMVKHSGSRTISPYHHLGSLYLKYRQFPKAEAAFRKALEEAPSGQTYLALGKTLFESARLQEAGACYQKAIALGVRDAEMFCDFGAVLIMSQNLPAGEFYLRQAVQLNPNVSKGQQLLGSALMLQNRHGSALQALGKAVEAEPRSEVPMRLFALALMKNQEWARAANAFLRCRELGNKQEGIADAYGETLWELGQYDQAEALFREVVAKSPTFYAAESKKALDFQKQSKKSQAAMSACKAMIAQPSQAEMHLQFGLMMEDLGRNSQAVVAYHKALELNPNYDAALLQLSFHYFKRKDFREAEAVCRKLLVIHPGDAVGHALLGAICRDQGQFDEALKAFRRSEELKPHPNNAKNIADCEQLKTRDTHFETLLKDMKTPASAAEMVAFAEFALRYKQRPALAMKFYAEALTNDPTLVPKHRFNAVKAALLAANKTGLDCGELSSAEQTRLRLQALAWLEAEVKQFQPLAGQEAGRVQLRDRLRSWWAEPALLGARILTALAAWPPSERAGWQRLWADVDALYILVAPPLGSP
jgi:serine/threonine protein kinase/tetratricopeptide (TPR) repeat protein